MVIIIIVIMMIIIIIVILMIIIITIVIIIIKMLFHKNRNTQIKLYRIQHLELETSKTCDKCSIALWEGTWRRP